MLTTDDYNNLREMMTDNDELALIINNASNTLLEGFSRDSHAVKNYLSYLKSNHQLLERKYTKLISDTAWIKALGVIDVMIERVDREALFQYSFKKHRASSLDMNYILCELPDLLDDYICNACDISVHFEDVANVRANYGQVRTLLLEAISNACEATEYVGKLRITSHMSGDRVIVQISNEITSESVTEDYSTLCQPFYTTKQHHTGLGLAIVHQICLSCGAVSDLKSADGLTVFTVSFPAET